MRVNRIVLSTVLVVVALILQVSVLARLHLPGAVPDLMLLVVVALALGYGHVAGCLIGFGAGLLADLAPPADHAAGRYALVLCVIGYLAGLARPESGQLRSAAMPMAVVAGAAVVSTLLYAMVGALVGDTAARHVGLFSLLFSATVYDLLLAPFTVPWIIKLARRTEREPTSGDTLAAPSPGQPYRWVSSASTGRGQRGSQRGSQRGGLLSRSRKP